MEFGDWESNRRRKEAEGREKFKKKVTGSIKCCRGITEA